MKWPLIQYALENCQSWLFFLQCHLLQMKLEYNIIFRKYLPIAIYHWCWCIRNNEALWVCYVARHRLNFVLLKEESDLSYSLGYFSCIWYWPEFMLALILHIILEAVFVKALLIYYARALILKCAPKGLWFVECWNYPLSSWWLQGRAKILSSVPLGPVWKFSVIPG